MFFRRFFLLLALLFLLLALMPGPALDARAQQRPVGINLTWMQDYSEFWMFVDAMKQSRSWIVQPAVNDGSVWETPGIEVPRRGDGYPTHVPFTVDGTEYVVHTLLLSDQASLYPSGDYTLLFEGTGQIDLEWDTGQLSFTESGVPHTVPITNPSEAGIHLLIRQSAQADPIRNIRFIMPGHAGTYDTDPWYPTLLPLLSNFDVIRFLKPMMAEDSPITDWADQSTPDFYSQATVDHGGLAPAHIVDLCNELQADPWINIPYLASDDYVRQYARYLRDNLDPGLTIYVEYSNEVWNSIYEVHFYAQDQGIALGLSDQPHIAGIRYQALRSFQIFSIFEEEFTDDTRLYNVLAGFVEGLEWTGQELMEASEDSACNPNDIEVDGLAIGSYFGGEVGPLFMERGDTLVTVDEVLDSTEAHLQNLLPGPVAAYRTFADQYGVELIAYEGGQHLDLPLYGERPRSLIDTLNAANRHDRMGQLYEQYFDIWYGESGNGLQMSFSFVKGGDAWGNFGLLESMDQDPTTAPKWMAHVDHVFTSVPERGPSAAPLPEGIELVRAWPNPFNGQVRVSYRLSRPAKVQGAVYDLLGREVARFSPGSLTAGSHTLHWDAGGLASGTYLLRLTSPGSGEQRVRLTLLK